MEACVGQGLTRHIGVSNFSVYKIKELLKDCSIKPEVNQLELHPFLQQNGMLNFCRQENIVLTAYSPLGSNDRPARLRTEDEPNLLQNPMIMEIAEHKNISAAQVLLCWAIQRGTIVIPKSVNPERLKQNLDSASIHLTDEEMSKNCLIGYSSKIYQWQFLGCCPQRDIQLTTSGMNSDLAPDSSLARVFLKNQSMW